MTIHIIHKDIRIGDTGHVKALCGFAVGVVPGHTWTWNGDTTEFKATCTACILLTMTEPESADVPTKDGVRW